MSTAILFRKCLGLNDARALGSQVMHTDPRDPEAGNAELIDSLNLTTTSDGCLEKLAPLVTALTHSAPVTAISAGKRFMLQDAIDTWEWTATPEVINRFPLLNGPIVHTPHDCRINSAGIVYKSVDVDPAVQVATVGVNPDPPTSKPFYAMPAFKQAFVYNAKLYAVNAEDPRFLQYSKDYHYDLYAIGDAFIGHEFPCLQAGAIKGSMIATHAAGVTVRVGSGPHDFEKAFYPCAVIDKTLYSGFISKVYGRSHVFLCDDGVYVVGQDGVLMNLTVEQTDHLEVHNSVYYCVTVQDGKYLAFGDQCALEYDFKTKTLLKRSTFGIVGAAYWNKVNYFATGSTVKTLGTAIDTTSSFPASMTLPFTDMNARGQKSVADLYFTGIIDGDVLITATDNAGKTWEKEVSELGTVYNHRIQTPRGMLGNHISFRIDVISGAFRIEELRAEFAASKRS